MKDFFILQKNCIGPSQGERSGTENNRSNYKGCDEEISKLKVLRFQ